MHRIGKILSQKRPLSEEDLSCAAEEGRKYKQPIGKVLVLSEKITEEDLYQALAEQYALAFTRIPEALAVNAPQGVIPKKTALKHICFPLKKENKCIQLAICDPRNLDIASELEFSTQCTIDRIVATESDILKAIEVHYSNRSQLQDSARSIARDLKETDIRSTAGNNVQALKRETEAEPIVKMVNLIIEDAIKRNASDIHIEPHENSLHVRNRVDGMLLEMMDLPIWMQSPITSRVKILADLDIAEKRTPQDGRTKRIVDGEEIDMRVSTLPTHHGEKTVIRLLRHNEALLQLESLGLDGKDLDAIVDLINKPQGMLFFTGPTGSGKSSTIFACLNRIKSKPINITTIEDPIEYKLPGINQVQINEKAGLTFAETLRSILRQDPDVILVGETRDTETAEIALQSSQTGHLVFSTLHTNDSASGITRLRDLGIPPFLIASGVLGIVAQRLVRLICPECKEPYRPSEEAQYRWKMVMGDTPVPSSFYGKGCRRCNNTGFKGRTGIYEFLKIDTAVRDMVSQNEPEHSIRAKALQKGMKRLVQHGLEKIETGITSVEELLRVVLVE